MAASRNRPLSSPPDFRVTAVAIVACVLLVYWPALPGTLLWDDAGHVTRPDLRSLAGLGRIWFELGATQQYYPILHSAFWLEHRLWGDATLGYHLVNVALHAGAAVLFGLLLRRLQVPGARFAAFLFALHPVAVESVAWISEQKNTLSAVLCLAAALAYLRFDDAPVRRLRPYLAATALFSLALLTKTVVATLPAALLVVFWWQRGRLGWRREVAPLLPWFALGAVSGSVTAWFERTLIGAQGAAFDLDPLERLLLAGRIVWFYLGKLLWPADLIFIYPRWTVDPSAPTSWLGLLGAVTLLGWCWHQRRASRAPLAGLLLFGGVLFPVLGFFNVYPFVFSFVADHFQYLASLPIFALAAAGLTRATDPAGPGPLPVGLRTPWSRGGLAAGLLAILGVLACRQAATYRDVFTLYETTLERNPACWMAHNNLGVALVDAGRADEALAHFAAATRLRPADAEAENNFGHALNQLGRPTEALPHLQRALQLHPAYAEAHNNLGVALMSLDRSADGLAAFAEALRLRPGYASAHFNLGLALARLGRTEQAIDQFAAAVKSNPGDAAAELSWGTGLMLLNRFPEAVPHFERALQLEPDSAANHLTYGRALANVGRLDEATTEFRAALRLDPDLAAAHLNLALALRRLGRGEEAQFHVREAERLGGAHR